MQYARSDAAGGVMDDRLFVVGGWDGEQEVAVCEYFDPAASSWAECPPMSLPRAGAGATVLGSNQLYVIGGGLQGEIPYAEVYDANAKQWKPIEMPMLENAPAWSHLGVTSVETRVYALGGRQGETIQSDNFVYEPFKHRTFLPTVGGDG
jgi:N-acetylneuraminic acid mutarotase